MVEQRGYLSLGRALLRYPTDSFWADVLYVDILAVIKSELDLQGFQD